MLHLASTTASEWIERAAANIDEVLLDHAHCERKAAGTALNLLFRYPNDPTMVLPLSELAREELAHFELCVSLIRERGREFKGQKASPYASELLSEVRRKEPEQRLDTLLCAALIEARSAERMKLLAETPLLAHEPTLQKLYKGLLASEARHHMLYTDLARGNYCENEIRERLAFLAQHEANVIENAPKWARMHT
jgi:tRNA 2-(methylsulfanyl)-N6-isopentenyladenosine37 hydroxylase